MEPISAFAAIVGLLCNYKSESRAASQEEYQDFIDWLSEKRHKDVVDELNSNHLLGLSIKNLLRQNSEAILSKLAHLDRLMLQLSSQIDGFKDIAQSIAPNINLSDQAISILVQIENAAGRGILESYVISDGYCYYIQGTAKGANLKIALDEPRFVMDDLEQLCHLGLLTPNYVGESRAFNITRSAVSFLKNSTDTI
ncbi:hypothetical protein [Pseudoalteromonas maricaloris]|uniref:hypothetical protein n=1 Tax=Pseudoalteromonas maricaloris TaxID=184924 RepID=UPI00029A9BFE|nr:hypothetical protein [Pseudoalteromonas flavipulchra]